MPAAPSGVSASAVSSSSISVTWTAVPGAASYQIYRSTSADYGYTRIGISTSSSYTNTGLSSNITYYYKVSAVNSAGLESPESSSVSAKTKIATPTWNSVAVGPTYVYLWWNPVWRAQGYRIYRSTSASGPYTQIGSSTDSYESYSDIGLSAKTTYYYKVSAFNNEGESELSEFYSVTTN
jgi:fibronectin type 3 domain-containing protein